MSDEMSKNVLECGELHQAVRKLCSGKDFFFFCDGRIEGSVTDDQTIQKLIDYYEQNLLQRN